MTTRETEAGVELNSGQTLVLSIMNPHPGSEKPAAARPPAAPGGGNQARSEKAAPGETELCLLVTPEIMRPADVPAVSPR